MRLTGFPMEKRLDEFDAMSSQLRFWIEFSITAQRSRQ
jgi:hypothetical protein